MMSKSRVRICMFLLLIASRSAAGADEAGGRNVLKGMIYDTDQKPVSGATVIVWTAAVKRGYSTYCPSCYLDCGKKATTTDQGSFEIRGLDQDLRFRLLVVRDGYTPTFIEKVDPSEGPVSTNLPAYERPSNPLQIVKGKVVDPKGRPIVGAVIEPDGVSYRDESGRLSSHWGAVKGLDPVAVSNAEGEFVVAYVKPAESMTLMVEARGMAAKRFEKISTGGNTHTLKMSRGATIRGRLMHRGKPVPDAQMGIVSVGRAMDQYHKEQRIGTMQNGMFSFSNVPTDVDWYVYAKMNSIAKFGATEAVKCTTKFDDQSLDVGEIQIRAGHRLQGKVILTDGKPIPDGMRIVISTNKAWDSQESNLPPDGRFAFASLPTDDYAISPSIKGYTESKRNPNLSWSIEGKIDHDLDDFIILMEPGQIDFTNRVRGKFRGQPLKSAPPLIQ